LPAISGIPPFAGFWSKDEILGSALPPTYFSGYWLANCGITAFYVRMYFTTFEGKFREMKLKSATNSSQPLGCQ